MSADETKNNAVTEPVENGSPKQEQDWDLSDLEDALAESPGFPDHESIDAIFEPYPHFKAFYRYIFPIRDHIQKSNSPLEVTKETVQPSDGQCRKCHLQCLMKIQEEIKIFKHDMEMKMEEQEELSMKVLDTFKEKWSKASAAFKGTFDVVSHIANSSDAMADDVTMILVKQGQSNEQGSADFKQYLKDYLNEHSVTKQDLDRMSTVFCTLHNRLMTENRDFMEEQMADLRKLFDEKLASSVEGLKEFIREENHRQLQAMDCRPPPMMSHPNSRPMSRPNSSYRNSAPLDNSFNHLNSINIKKEIVDDDIRFIGKRKHNFRDQSIQMKPYSDYFLKKTIPVYSVQIEPLDLSRNAADHQLHQNDVKIDSAKVIIADVSKPHENSAFTNREDKNVTRSPADKVKIELKRQKIAPAKSQPSTGVMIMNKMPLKDRNVNTMPPNMNDTSNVTVVPVKPLVVDSSQLCKKPLKEEYSNEKIDASVTSPVPHPKKHKKNNAQRRKGRKEKNPKENALKVAPVKEKETFLIEDDDCVIVDEIFNDPQSSFGQNVSGSVDVKGKNAEPKPCNPPSTKTARVPCYTRGLVMPIKKEKGNFNNSQNVFDLKYD